jgi:hypothetical protein
MGQVLGDILVPAIGIAISPVPIIAVILMLFSAKARENGPAFLGGWLLGVAGVLVVVIAVTGAAGGSSGGPSTLASLVQLALGILLLVMGVMQWKKRPAPGQPAETPKWMSAVDGMQPTQAFVLGVALSAANPKNLTLAAAAAITIGKAALDLGPLFVVIVVFVFIASISIIVPVGYYLFGGEGAQKTLDGWKSWLEANNAVVMTVLLVVMGVAITGKGLGALLG